MFTPQEVSDKVFPKASGFGGGYQMAAVDEFLDTLTEDYTSLYKENVTLKTKLKVLAEKVEEYRATEDSMRATLLTAQRMADKMVKDAEYQRDNMVAQARRDAAEEIARLDAETEIHRRKLAQAQEALAAYIAESRQVLARQEAFLAQLPQIEERFAAPAEEPRQAEAPEAPIELPPEEEPEKPEPFPTDFKLSLDELKFGRNYGERK